MAIIIFQIARVHVMWKEGHDSKSSHEEMEKEAEKQATSATPKSKRVAALKYPYIFFSFKHIHKFIFPFKQSCIPFERSSGRTD